MSARHLVGMAVTAIGAWFLWLHDWDYILDFSEAAIPKSDKLFFTLFPSVMLLFYGIAMLNTIWAHLLASMLITIFGAYLVLNFESSTRSPWPLVLVGIIWFIAGIKELFTPKTKTVGRHRKPEPQFVIPRFLNPRKWLNLLSDRKNHE